MQTDEQKQTKATQTRSYAPVWTAITRSKVRLSSLTRRAAAIQWNKKRKKEPRTSPRCSFGSVLLFEPS